MQDFLERISHFSPKRLALLAAELQGRIEKLEGARHEPIAIVGIGCRFPGGADSPEKYWSLVREGVDAITEVPPDRWDIEAFFDADPDAPGKMSTRWGGFVGPVDGFDAHFFGISPREAASLDPQQRLLLETTWRALEHAGIDPTKLEGTRTGVFAGLSAGDYYQLLRAGGTEAFDAYTASGTAHSIASGRLSYFLGLRGPSVSIDTACSSSLVAIHQAVHSLRRGECDLALAGGVNLILAPDITIALSKSHMMAPDGRCKAFDARADGFVRGEGCGIVVLKRLADARRDADRIVALIRGSAANQDGRSNGLTAPNGQAQEAVLRDALADARCEAHAVGFVENHGTGTSLGDPIEVRALQAVLGAGREKSAALRVGSVKSNIGHLEAAAGVAGLVKAALALAHREIPGQSQLRELNPYIAWDEMAVEVLRATVPWPSPGGGPRMAGVSSFGFSGTNVHLILEEAPEPAAPALEPDAEGREQAPLEERTLHLLAVSARNDAALRAACEAQAEALAASKAPLGDIAHTLGAGRAHFAHRAAVIAATHADASKALAAMSRGESAAPHGVAGVRAPRVGFLFTGQGSQYAGMARGLHRTEAAFRDAFDRCDALLAPQLARPLREVVFPAEGAASPIDDTTFTQPALFAVEYALAQLWLSWGVKPAAVMGHSVGEYVAACVAGVLSLEDALTLIAARGRLMGALPSGGAMAAIMAEEAQVAEGIGAWSGELGVAAVNGPRNVVISGAARAVDAAIARFESQGVKGTRLKVSHAFHSPLMAPMLDEFMRVASGLKYAAPGIDLVSNVTGGMAGAAVADPAYWSGHVMAPVQFARAVRAMASAGCTIFVEVGPHPVLLGMAAECVEGAAAWIPSLRRGRDDHAQFLESAAHLYVRGVEIDWHAADRGHARWRVLLPGYAFQRDRYWLPDSAIAAATAPAGAVLPPEKLRRLLHEVAWREGPRAGAGLADAGTVALDLRPRVDPMARQARLDDYAVFAKGLDALCAGYVVRALRELGFAFRAGESFEAEGLRRHLDVKDAYKRLFARMLDILREDGVLEDREGTWRALATPAEDDLEERYAALLAAHPDAEAELALTRRCAGGMSAVMRGEADPLPLLFPGGSLGDTEKLYQASPPARTYNGLIAAALDAMLASWPQGRRLRILEIGAGTGSTTSYLLPRLARLPEGAVDYCFTDVSPLFLKHAREKFPGVAFLRTQLLDIGADLRAQGFEPASFDLVVAANVLHATPDVAASLRHVRELLAPGGRIVLLEGATPQRFGDLTVGLLDGWWCYTDTHRRGYALMPRESWLGVLAETGFAAAEAIPGEDSGPLLRQQAIYVADVPAAKASPGRWLVVPDRAGVAEALSAALRGRGAQVEMLASLEEDAIARALAAPCAGVAHLAALDAAIDENTGPDALMQAQRTLMGGAVALVQRMSARAGASPPLWFATRGAQATSASEPADPSQATVWGLSHVVALEHPELACHRVDLDPAADAPANAAALAEELVAGDAEDQLALRAGRRLLRRVVHAGPRPAASQSVRAALDPAKAYLVTGGLRGLGLLVAEWLANRGARNIALMGRQAPDARARAVIAQLERQGAKVLALQGDVSREPDVRTALDRIAAELAPLAGIVHAAGVLDDGVLASQSWPRFEKVMAPKVLGTWHLHRLAGRLDFLVLFSSGASLAGSAGQANHAAANAFEDALAWYRQARGAPTVSINWGPWAEVGAAVDRSVHMKGLDPLAPVDAFAALEHAMRSARAGEAFACAQYAVFDTDWSHLVEVAASGRLAPVFGELLAGARALGASKAAVPDAAADAGPGLRERIRAAMPNRRRAILRDHVRQQTMKVLGLAQAEGVDVHEPLRQMGLDSLMAVELRNHLGRSVERALPATLTFDHPTIAALVDHLVEVAFPEEIGAAEAAEPVAEAPREPSQALDGLTDEELAARLASRLERLSAQGNS